MSINVSIRTPSKKAVSKIVVAIAEMIAISSNETVDVEMQVKFNADKKKKDC